MSVTTEAKRKPTTERAKNTAEAASPPATFGIRLDQELINKAAHATINRPYYSAFSVAGRRDDACCELCIHSALRAAKKPS